MRFLWPVRLESGDRASNPMETTKPFIDIQEVMREIRERIRPKTPESAAAGSSAVAGPHPPALELAGLREAAHRVRLSCSLVGQMPPQPPSLRARIGAKLVRIVQRMLFWYTPQILQFHTAVTQAIVEHVSLLGALSGASQESSQALGKLDGAFGISKEECYCPCGKHGGFYRLCRIHTSANLFQPRM